MRCEELWEWLSADLDGEASAAEQAVVREHLRACAGCRRARAAAAGLSEELSLAARAAVASERDEALLAVLCPDGICRADYQPRRHKEHKEVRLLTAWLAAITGVFGPILEFCRSSCSSCLRGFYRTHSRSLRLAAGVVTISFLATWGALRWAEMGQGVTLGAPAAPAATAQRLPAGDEMLNEWMAGTPSMAALERLQRLPPAAPPASAAVRRGAASVGERRRIG